MIGNFFDSLWFGDSTESSIHSFTLELERLPTDQRVLTLCRVADAKDRDSVGQLRPSELIHVYSTVVGPAVVISPVMVAVNGHRTGRLASFGVAIVTAVAPGGSATFAGGDCRLAVGVLAAPAAAEVAVATAAALPGGAAVCGQAVCFVLRTNVTLPIE